MSLEEIRKTLDALLSGARHAEEDARAGFLVTFAYVPSAEFEAFDKRQIAEGWERCDYGRVVRGGFTEAYYRRKVVDGEKPSVAY